MVLLFFISENSFSQAEEPTPDSSEKNIDFVPIPYLSYHRQFGGMFGVVPTIMYKVNKKDTISPASMSGLLGLYTTNGSWAVAGFSQWFLNEDKWRVILALGTGNTNATFFQPFPVDAFIDYSAAQDYAMIEVKRKITKGTFIGINYVYTKFNNEFDTDPPTESVVKLYGLGAVLNYDTRDNVYYPYKGIYSGLRFTTYEEWLGNDEGSNQIKARFNTYFNLKNKRDVIAARLFLGFGLGTVPFNKQLVLGKVDLRGYTEGRFRGKQLVVLQGEYRYNFAKRWSGVGFLGVGSVFGGDVEGDNNQVLPSIGAGFRYNVFPKNHLNIGLEGAVGKDDWGIYFRIGESF